MALVQCPECDSEVSDQAESCPKCGLKRPGDPKCCPECDALISPDMHSCRECGYRLRPTVRRQVRSRATRPRHDDGKLTSTEKAVAIVICFFLGGLGFHRLYLGRPLSGFLMLLYGGIGLGLCVLSLSGRIGPIGLALGASFVSLTALIALIDLFLIAAGVLKRKVR